MGTSLSGLTPATTFDGLLKTSDNEPIGATLKTISDGSGVDSILQLSNSALKINGGQATIVGAGNSSATTALLIQNSEGVTLLKANDSRDLYLGSSTSNYIHQGIFFQGDYRAPGDWNFGTAIDLGAKLGIKGSGATSATTSLLVQNSAGATGFQVDDGGNIGLGNAPLTGIKVAQTSGAARFRDLYFGNIGSSAINNSSLTSINWNGSTGIGIANSEALAATAMLHVKGSGATSATAALLVQNSAGTEHLKVTDDGVTNVRSALNVNHPSVSSRFIGLAWGSISANSTNDELSLYGGGSTLGSIMYLNASGKSSAPAAMGMKTNGMLVASAMVQSSFAPDASAQLQVDSTTKGFLPPRMAEGERDAISTPAAGLMIYNTDTNVAECWNGSAWMVMF